MSQLSPAQQEEVASRLIYKLLDERASLAAKKIYEDIFRADMVGRSQFEDDRVAASRRVGHRKKLIMTEYLRLRKEALNRTLIKDI